jgi:hypothetical protein
MNSRTQSVVIRYKISIIAITKKIFEFDFQVVLSTPRLEYCLLTFSKALFEFSLGICGTKRAKTEGLCLKLESYLIV